jgi:hypothetical protein
VIVAIQPAYGDAWTRRQFIATLDQPVSFSDRCLQQLLSPEQRRRLAALHPSGRAACWGGTRSQSAKLSVLEHGDLVLFTGQRRIQGVGRVGTVVDNQAFAEALWSPHPRRCSFMLAFSLTVFRRTDVPYEVLQSALGTSERDNFQALRLIRDQHRVEDVCDLVSRRLLYGEGQ